jgi:2-hydroxychromene-2-carboxylate isomerase
LSFYFDPRCPWAWRTSLWAREVQRLGLVSIEWRLFSLAEINRNPEVTPDVGPMDAALRTLLLARRRGGMDAIDRLYLALGRARHERREDLKAISTIEAALVEAGLDRRLSQQALDDPSTDQEVLDEHRDVVARYGAFGVPWLVLGDCPFGFFGPVIDTVPEGEAARALWEHTAWFLTQPAFFELKRPH